MNMSISHKKIALYIDLVFCLVVLPLVLSIIPIEKMFANATLFTLILITFLYMVYFMFRRVRIPSLIMKGKYVHACLFIGLLLISTFLLAHFPFTDSFAMKFPEEEISRISAHRAQRVWFLFLVTSGFSLVIDLTFELFRQMIVRKDIEDAKNRAQLSLYKAQINPHFLFNSLNTIYSMIINRSEHTEEAFIKFTDILKYMYDQPTADSISIEREFEYIGNYIQFQKLRHNGHTTVKWDCSMDDHNVQIPPMLLITFVENAFKYGSSSRRDCQINISAHVNDGNLIFKTENQIIRRPSERSEGIGIENCRNRLELLYPDRYCLDIKEEGEKFMLNLTINL